MTPGFYPISTHKFSMDTSAPRLDGGIYVIEHTLTGRAYVGRVTAKNGRGFQKRCREHFYNATQGKSQHAKSRFGNFVRKYGVGDFLFHVAKVIGAGCSLDEFDLAERSFIEMFDAAGPGGFNLHPHATTPLGTKRSDETKRRMSESRMKMLAENHDLRGSLVSRMSKIANSDESRAATAARNSDPKNIKARGDGLRARYADPIKLAETRERLQAHWTPELRDARASKCAEMWADPSKRLAISTPIECSSGVLYASINDAARALGVSKTAVSRHVAGLSATCSGKVLKKVDREYAMKNIDRISK